MSILEPLHIEHYVTKKADWHTFKSAASEAFESVFLTDDTSDECYYGLIKQAIITAADQFILLNSNQIRDTNLCHTRLHNAN